MLSWEHEIERYCVCLCLFQQKMKEWSLLPQFCQQRRLHSYQIPEEYATGQAQGLNEHKLVRMENWKSLKAVLPTVKLQTTVVQVI